MKEFDKKLKRKVGALIVLGLFLAITLATPTFGWSGSPDGWSLNQQGSTTVEAVYVDSSSKVGIYDTTPDATLEIVDTGTTPFMISSTASGDGDYLIMDTNGRLGITDDGPDFKMELAVSSGSGFFGVSTAKGNDGDVFVIDSGGRVGIKDSSPDYKFELEGYSGSGFVGVTSASDGDIFVIDTSGNVGIGESSPAAKLEIDGNILFNKHANRMISIETPTSTTVGNRLTISSGDASSPSMGLAGGDLVLHAGSGAGGSGSHGGDVYVYGGPYGNDGMDGDVILAHTGSVARGRVGIGTASPDNLLEIVSTSTQFRITHTDATDYATFDVDGNGKLEIRTYDGGGSSGDIVLIPDGDVGIGTSPSTKLHVYGDVAFGEGSELTISSGEITAVHSYHTVDCESGTEDDLDTINGGSVAGEILIIRAANPLRTVNVIDYTGTGGNLILSGDFEMDNAGDTLTLIYSGSSYWFELSRSDNGA